VCELSEQNRSDRETIIDLNQKVKTYEAQIQTLKSEKSNINAEYLLAKNNLEIYENEKYE
jgi:hypothetical protein